MRAQPAIGIALLSLLVLCGCDLNALIPEDARTFTVPATSSVTVPGTFSVGQSPLAPDEVIPADLGSILSSQLQQEFSTQDVQKEAVASMKLTGMKLTVEDAVENGTVVRHAGFLSSLEFSMTAGELDPVLVAFSGDGAFDGEPTEYDFELTDAELVDVLNGGDALIMSGDLETDGRPNFDTTLRFDVETTVIADAVGAVESQT
jgi:hypothetical protein